MAKATLNRRTKTVRNAGSKSLRRRIATKRRAEFSTHGSPERKTIEQLAAEQGVNLKGQYERLLGLGADLWESDEEFEEFVQGIYDRRREGARLSKR